eukprot:133439-Rhodomonas_salina.1
MATQAQGDDAFDAAEKCRICAISWGSPSHGGVCSSCAPAERRTEEWDDAVVINEADASGDEGEDRMILAGATAMGAGVGMMIGGGLLAAAGAGAGALSVTRSGAVGETSRKVSRSALRAGRSVAVAAGRSLEELRNSEVFETVQCRAAAVKMKACLLVRGVFKSHSEVSSDDEDESPELPHARVFGISSGDIALG